MIKGIAEVHGTALGFMTFGSSRQHLWFKNPMRNREKVIESGGYRTAWRCDTCKCTVIDKEAETELAFQQLVEFNEGRT
jgi:hypothetical protein